MLDLPERLHRLFDDGREASLAELVAATGRSERQVRRALDALRARGVRVRHRRDGLVKRFSLPPAARRETVAGLALSDAELAALTVAASAAGAVLAGTPHLAPLRSALGKLLERVAPVAPVYDADERARLWRFEPPPEERTAPEAVWAVLEAGILERRAVRIDYFTAGRGVHTAGRKVHPLVFARKGRALLVVAWCTEAGGYRNFAVQGITAAALCDPAAEAGAYFDPPAGFDPASYFRDALGVLTDGAVHTVRLLVEADRAEAFRRHLYHDTQQVEEDGREDGRLVVSFEAEGFEDLRAFVQGWGVGVTVLDPPALRDRIAAEARTLAERYGC